MVDRIDRLDELIQLPPELQGDLKFDADENDDDAFHRAARAMQNAAHLKPGHWPKGLPKTLLAQIAHALRQAKLKAEKNDPSNRYAVLQAMENARANLKKLMDAMNPPPEILDSEDFEEMMELLRPQGLKRRGHLTGKGDFKKGSGFKGAVKGDMAQGQVKGAIEEAEKLAEKKLQMQKGDQQLNTNLQNFSQMGLEQMARYLKRKMRKLKKKRASELSEEEEVALAEEEALLREEIELFTQKGLNAMKAIREEIAPRWAPEQQPWIINETEKHVFDIILAGIPEDLFKETQAWGEIQDLREGQEVFTLRAADKLTDAARRK